MMEASLDVASSDGSVVGCERVLDVSVVGCERVLDVSVMGCRWGGGAVVKRW